MARNRKNNDAAIRFGPALRVVLVFSFLVASGVGYLWQKVQINRLGQDRKDLEIRLDQLKRRNEILGRTWALSLSPADIDAQVRRMNLNLVAPQPNQIVRLVERNPALHGEGDTTSTVAGAGPANGGGGVGGLVSDLWVRLAGTEQP